MKGNGKIIITGDCCPGIGRVKEPAIAGKAEVLFGDYLSMIKDAELSITNLESPLTDKGEAIAKTGPNLKSPPSSIRALKEAGFDLFTLANNHILDYGRDGLVSTLNTCREFGIATVGAGMSSSEAQENHFCEVQGTRISVINFAENEFGTTQNNTAGGHPLDPVQNFNTIRDAKKKSDRVIVIVHGGHEHYSLPSPRMKQTYRFFVDAGADAVLGHHTHCLSGYEVYNNAPIFYGIGNFLFDDGKRDTITPWNFGIIVQLTVEEKGVSFNYHFFKQNHTKTGLVKPTLNELSELKQKISVLNKSVANNSMLEKEFQKFCNRSKKRYASYVEPHSSRVLHFLRNRNLLPSFLTKRKKLLYLNLIRCEAHRDILIQILNDENSHTSA